MYAETRTNCGTYNWCVSPTQAYYMTCASGLLFNNARQYCDWAANVSCGSGPTPTPTPTPSPSPQPSPSPAPSPSPRPPSPAGAPAFDYAVYLESWADAWAGSAATSKISEFPSYVTHLILSFMLPDTTYPGGVTFQGTGVQFSSDPQVVKDAIALLKQKNPHTKVLIAVGGATYTGWNNLNAAAVAKFVQAFGLDGVDVDYEPSSTSCSLQNGQMQCSTDAQYIAAIRGIRAAVPRPYIVSTAAWSVGAYGEGQWQNALPGSQYTGVAIAALRQAGDDLDIVNIMSYDASAAYDPKAALDAYSHYFSGKVLLGLEVAPESWGGHVISNAEVDSLAAYVKQKGTAGMMLWAAYKQATAGTPTGAQISSRVCNALGLWDCATPMP